MIYENCRLARVSRHQWVTMPPIEADISVIERCTESIIAKALVDVTGATVKSIAVNLSGQYRTPSSFYGVPSFVEDNLPDYCEVLVHQVSPAGHIAEVLVWVPLLWNRRFLGTGGNGNRTTSGFLPGDQIRVATLADAVRNGFAAARTDGAVGNDPRLADWQLDEVTGQLDWELIENWTHRSTHEMTVIGKAVTTAIHGTEPRFSYFQGNSGGGRQAMAEVQRYPDDYDGVWAADPAINWARFMPAGLWPQLVMKELGNALAPEKFEAFRRAAVEDFNERHGTSEPFTTSHDSPVFDANRIVGLSTDAGDITKSDAEVMNLIWEGPKSPSGEWLWFGLRPGAESWGNTPFGFGMCITSVDENGNRQLEPFALFSSWFTTWLVQDPKWDWTTLTFEEYARLFKEGVEKFADAAIDDPDLSGLRESGGKLLLTHGIDDQVIASQGSRVYFDRVLEHMGGAMETGEFVRFFFCPDDGHGICLEGHFGVDLATGMVALINWVENGVAPETLDVPYFAPDDATTDRKWPVKAYGSVAEIISQ